METQRNKIPKLVEEPSVDAMAGCVFHEDIMLCILTRLPVESIARFKSVCKPWLELFSTPEFRKSHHGQFSSDPKNQSIIFYGSTKSIINRLNIFEPNEKKNTAILDHPFPENLDVGIIGCINGLLCLGDPKNVNGIILCNPALKLYKSIRLSDVVFGDTKKVSLGFGYDALGDDFKVVKITYVFDEGGLMEMSIGGVEVYSANSDSWTTIEPGFQFIVFSPENALIVNGNPYWLVIKSGCLDLVYFDVAELVFKVVPRQGFVKLMDWNGAIGAIMCNEDKEKKVTSLEVWVFDDGEGIWKRNHTFGRIEVRVDKFLLYVKNGKILGLHPGGDLFLFDTKNECVCEIVAEEAPTSSFGIHGYTESLVCINGMKQVEWRKRKAIDDGPTSSNI